MGSANPLTGRSILVVEDEPLIALEMAALLQSAGAKVLAARTVAEAMNLAQGNVCGAIVDYGMGDTDTSAFCRHLTERGIRFMFYTGYSNMDVAYPGAVIVQKPASADALVGAMSGLIAPRAA
jgi:CheY-like chemotaxis protein